VAETTSAGTNFKGSSAPGNLKAYVPLHNRATANRRRMRVLSWRPLVKESLRRFANVHPLIGLVIHDVPVLISGGNVWATLPSKPQTDPEARLKRDTSSKAYSAILKWRDRTLADRFSAAVIELIVEEHGAGALDGGGSR
jgi:hypothetical protein